MKNIDNKNDDNDINEILEVLNNINEHIVFDKNINSICYSAQLIKTLHKVKDILGGLN